MSEEFYNRLALGEEGNRTVLNNNVDGRSHRHAYQYSVQGNTSQSTAPTSRVYRIDNRVENERTEVNLHLKHRPLRRTVSDSNSRGRYISSELNNRHVANVDGERRVHLSSSSLQYEGDERISGPYSSPNQCDGTALDGYMPEIPRKTPASKEQPVVTGEENTNASTERMEHYGGSEWNGASVSSPSVTCVCEGGSFANYTQSSGKQAQLCPHVKGQQSLREDNNNVSCVSFSDRDDKRYSASKHHIANRCDRYIYHPELEPQYKSEHLTNGPPSYYRGIQTENMMRWKNTREKNGRQIPGSSYANEKVGKKTRYASSDRNVNSSDSESGPSSSEREYWTKPYCNEKKKKRVKRKSYRSKHYLGESDPSEHSDPGHHRYKEVASHVCCTSGNGDCDYDQVQRSRSAYLLNNRRNISRSLTSVSSLDEESNPLLGGGFTFNRISPRGKGKARISKINIKSFSTVHTNASRFTRATSSASDIGNMDAEARLYALEKGLAKTPSKKTARDNPTIAAEQSDSSCTSPSLQKSPFNSHLVGRKSSTSGGETPRHTPLPRICSPEIVDERFQAPPSSSFKTIHAPDSESSSCINCRKDEGEPSVGDSTRLLKGLIHNLENDVESEDETEQAERPETLPLQPCGNNEKSEMADVFTSPDRIIDSPITSGLFLNSVNDLQMPLSPGGTNRACTFPFGKDTPYSIQKPFVTLANIQEQDEAVCNSDGSYTEHGKKKRQLIKRKTSKEESNYSDENEEDIVSSPRRRPSYVIAQNSGQMPQIAHQDENTVESNRTKPNGKEKTSYHELAENLYVEASSVAASLKASSESDVHKVKAVPGMGSAVDEEEKDRSDQENISDSGSSRRRPKKMERPRIPTILNLDEALDELFDDVKNTHLNGTDKDDAFAKRTVSRQESAPLLSTEVTEIREPKKRSNSIDDPSSGVKLIASEADSLYMQRADGKVERRHDKTDHEKSDIDRSLELLDELVVELSEKQSQGTPSERPSLSRNVDGKSAGSVSDVVVSPSPSQTSINSEKSTSGNEQIHKDVPISPLSETYPSRYHSDPTPRTPKDYTFIQETITETDIKARNSNSEPAINGKLLEEAADLVKAKAAEKEQNGAHKTAIERTASSPADLQAVTPQPTQKLRRRESEKSRRRQAAKAQIEANAKESGAQQNKLEDGTTGTQDEQQNAPGSGDSVPSGTKGSQGIPAGTEHRTWPRTGAEPEPKEPGKKKKATKSEMRWHVVQNLFETEKSYVQSLQSLVKEYLNPLRKNDNIVEPALVNEMFYQIPEILKNHEVFLKQLSVRVQDWSNSSKIGDIFVSAFTKFLLMDAYSQFINHFLHARSAVRTASLAKPGFLKYCEQRARDHKEKLTLQDLMIMPVQRIPRYVLIITDLLKYTLADHPDHGNLHLALGEIKTLAERMNKGELEADQAEKEAERLRDLEASIEGISSLVSPKRKYKRQDLVAEIKNAITKKDRCLFLFSDLLVCATVKRKQTSLRRGSLSLFSGQSAAEMNKYRLLWQYPLDDVELVTTNGDVKGPGKTPEQIQRDKLEQDLNTVSKISKLTESVSIMHQTLDDAIRDLASQLNRQLMEQQIASTFQSFQNRVELNIGSREPIENYVFLFLSTEIKSSWEAYFLDAKQQLAYAKDSSPNFQSAIPINKSRSGLQFTCASPTIAPRLSKRGTHCGSGDVWVASSDGCVGQVSMLSPQREFEQGMTNSPCQSRILCISPVPGLKLVGINTSNLEYNFKGNGGSTNSTLRSNVSKSSGYNSDDNLRGSVSSTPKAAREEIIAFDSSTDDEDMGEDSFTTSPSPPSFDGRLSPEGSSLGTAGSLDGDLSSDERDESDLNENASSDDEGGKERRRHDKKHLGGRCPEVDDKESNQQTAVWMGTEDGYIYIFPVTNPVKQRRNKTKIQKSAAIQCILYVDNQVFVALANGDLSVYKRSPTGHAWEINSPKNINISSNARITCITAILGRLWVGCQNQIVVVNTTTLEIETRFNASMDSNLSLHAMASSGMGVWISVQSQSVIRLFHATTFEHLADVDTKEAVHKMLAGSDAIIKQHKLACLRVTALLTCKDLLWIGTSAGVVLTLPLPLIALNTTSIQTPLDVTASPQGHTGHVRFLTAVETGKPDDKDEGNSNSAVGRSPRRTQINIDAKSPFPSENILIISGGDGYEDFKSSANESAGREDSTNHLLIWKV